jgi:FlaG/FlaF family flagellin (archaellin)
VVARVAVITTVMRLLAEMVALGEAVALRLLVAVLVALALLVRGMLEERVTQRYLALVEVEQGQLVVLAQQTRATAATEFHHLLLAPQ